MNENMNDLPPELGAKFLSFLREVNGQFEVVDKEGLILFVAEHGVKYPSLFKLFELNEEAVIENFKGTGAVPAGVKVIYTETHESDNVTDLRVFNGPIPPKS